MMKFSKKKLALAVGTVLGAASLIPSAQAVNLATDDLGQVLIFPYYTTRAGWNTLFNITNTSDKVVVIKVRFHETYNSRDVFDFNVIMSPRDVWNGWVSNGPGNMPQFTTGDNSCTVPPLPVNVAVPFEGNFEGNAYGGRLAYTGAAADGGPTTIERMSEGYVTVLMMGAAEETDAMASNAVHNTNTGKPKDCGKLVSAFADPFGFAKLNESSSTGFPQYAGINPLKGIFSLVNSTVGQNAGGSAVTLANFVDEDNTERGSDALVTLQLPPEAVAAGGPAEAFKASYHEPSLNAANTTGIVLLADGTAVPAPPALATNYEGVNNVSWVLLRDNVINHWTKRTDAATGWLSRSDWVVTFPTKAFFVDNTTLASNTEWAAVNIYRGARTTQTPAPIKQTSPFTEIFNSVAARPGTSCDPVRSYIYNREERGGPAPIYSPGVVVNNMCYEANVLTFAGSNVLGAAQTRDVRLPVGVDGKPIENGWMRINLASVANTLNGLPVTTSNPGYGLPVVGFSITTRTTPNSLLLNEAYLIDHSYTRRDPFAPTAP